MAAPPEIAVALARLGAIFGSTPTGMARDLYAEALAKLSGEALRRAVVALIEEHERYFPTPGEIRAAALRTRPELPRSSLAPEHRLLAPDRRSLEEIAADRRRLAPLWGEVRRVMNGGELRPFGEVLADLDAGRLGLEDATTPSAPRDEAAIRTQIAAWERELAADG